MEVTGKIISILPEERFNNARCEIVINGFVIKTNGQFSHDIAFTVFGAEKWEKLKQYIQENANVQVLFDVTSRQYKGEKWFTQCNAYMVRPIGGHRNDVVTNGELLDNNDTQYANNEDSALPF